jgi:hypothetical protein
LSYNPYIHGNVTGNNLCSYLKQIKMPFFLLQNQRLGGRNRSCPEGWYQWEGEGGGERVKEGEFGANTVYTYM